MAKIAFVVDIEEGHLFGTLGLACALRDSGHEVVYISIPDNIDHISADGFPLYPMFSEIYPPGYRKKYKLGNRAKGVNHMPFVDDHLNMMIDDSIEMFLDKIKPDLLILNCFMLIESLIFHYKFDCPQVILWTCYRRPNFDIVDECKSLLMSMNVESAIRFMEFLRKRGVQFNTLQEIVKPMAGFPELITGYGELELPAARQQPKAIYIGANLVKRGEGRRPSLLDTIGPDKRIIYASMGSQTIIYGESWDRFFHSLIEVMERKSMQGSHLVISIGKENDSSKYTSELENVTALPWLPQVDLLKEACLAIVHGGLGTINECIWHRVPMLFMPVARDSFANAKRVEHHQLGLQHAPFDPVDDLEEKMLFLLKSPEIARNVKNMQKTFVDLEQKNLGLQLIEQVIQREAITSGKPVITMP